MANLTRFRPKSSITSMRSELDRMIHDMFGETDTDGEEMPALWSPRMDIIESDDSYLATFDLPGLKREDIKVNFENNTVSISGEREVEHSEERQNYHRMERSFGRFYCHSVFHNP